MSSLALAKRARMTNSANTCKLGGRGSIPVKVQFHQFCTCLADLEYPLDQASRTAGLVKSRPCSSCVVAVVFQTTTSHFGAVAHRKDGVDLLVAFSCCSCYRRVNIQAYSPTCDTTRGQVAISQQCVQHSSSCSLSLTHTQPGKPLAEAAAMVVILQGSGLHFGSLYTKRQRTIRQCD